MSYFRPSREEKAGKIVAETRKLVWGAAAGRVRRPAPRAVAHPPLEAALERAIPAQAPAPRLPVHGPASRGARLHGRQAAGHGPALLRPVPGSEADARGGRPPQRLVPPARLPAEAGDALSPTRENCSPWPRCPAACATRSATASRRARRPARSPSTPSTRRRRSISCKGATARRWRFCNGRWRRRRPGWSSSGPGRCATGWSRCNGCGSTWAGCARRGRSRGSTPPTAHGTWSSMAWCGRGCPRARPRRRCACSGPGRRPLRRPASTRSTGCCWCRAGSASTRRSARRCLEAEALEGFRAGLQLDRNRAATS